VTCEPPYAAISALCYGKYCDNNYLFCWPWVQQEQGLLFNQSGGTWSPYISEEAPNNSVVCGSPGNITGVLDGMRATGPQFFIHEGLGSPLPPGMHLTEPAIQFGHALLPQSVRGRKRCAGRGLQGTVNDIECRLRLQTTRHGEMPVGRDRTIFGTAPK